MTKLNISQKSQLAKLLATENLVVEHNNVKTASFDTLNRILTLPVFKVQSGDVYDMLIAHECSHALYTPADGWKKIQDDNELRSYVNVLEDTRIDLLIQKKYPGVIKNYLNGFDIMNKQNFFGLKDKNINNDLMLIDKINLRSKSLNRLPFVFSSDEKAWLVKVDKLKTFNQVIKLAKEMLDWQKKQIDKLKKLPNFDDLSIVKNYLDKDDSSDNKTEDTDKVSQEAEKGNTNSESKQDQPAVGTQSEKDNTDNKQGNATANGPVGGGKKTENPLSAITDKTFEMNKQVLFDNSVTYNYASLPEPVLDKIVISNKEFRNIFKKFYKEASKIDRGTVTYLTGLKKGFLKHKNDQKKTVMYLVKEFEMKKAATAYKRASTDKTGVIDPLKLKNYKFSDDIFKRLTILPNEKNHGMMMLLDWSGSMSDCISQTIDQLLNLVWFCQKTNIPFDVYFFTSEDNLTDRNYDVNDSFKFSHNTIGLDQFRLVNIANHRMKGVEIDESLMHMYSMGQYWNRSYRWDLRDSYNNYQSYHVGVPKEFYLGSTPLNEALVACNKMIPIFKHKFNIEKMTFITLTDGGSNSGRGQYTNTEEGLKLGNTPDGSLVIKHNKKYYKQESYGWWRSHNLTANILDIIRSQHNINTIGFYVLKRLRGWEAERYFPAMDKKSEVKRKQFSKDKVTTHKEPGYNQYFIINGKSMQVENTNLNAINPNLKTGKIKQIFVKSMTNRIKSRVLLNKFIEQVA